MEQAPFHDDVSQGPSGHACWLTAEDGLRLRLAIWPYPEGSKAGAAKGTVLMFPGRTEYVEKYGISAAEFQARGYASIAVDWRGQGLADRMLPDRLVGHVGRFADYQHDVRAVMQAVRAAGLPEPYYLIGHSMGGCIGLRASMEGLDVRAAAFSAPMWGIILNPVLRPLAWASSTVARAVGMGHQLAPSTSRETYVLAEPFEGNSLTTDPEMFALLQKQMQDCPDLALGGPSMHWLNESLREMRRLARLPSPDLPGLTFLGTAEKIVDPARIRDRMARWPNGRLELLDGGEHEVMIEVPVMRNRLYDETCAFFDAA